MQRPDSVKQGDKFRVVGGDCPFGEYKDGDILEYQCETCTDLLFFAKGIEVPIDWTDVEPLTAFKVGDRVRSIKETFVGKEGFIIFDDKTSIPFGVNFSGEIGWKRAENLELIASEDVVTTEEACHVPESVLDAIHRERIQQAIRLNGWIGFAGDISSNKPRKGIMSHLRDIPKRIKKLLDPKTRALYQLGWINDELELTDKGEAELTELLYDEYKDKLGELAQKEVKRINDEEKK